MIQINVFELFWLVIGILGGVCLVYLIVLIFNATKLVRNLNDILIENKRDLAKSIENMQQLTDNAKDISEVLTETTADALIVKENISNQLNSVKNSFGVAHDIFTLFKKK